MQAQTEDPRSGLHKNSGRMTVNEVLFESWRTGINRSQWVSTDGRVVVRANYRYTAWSCSVDGVPILGQARIRANGHVPPKAFRSERAAMRAGVAKTSK